MNQPKLIMLVGLPASSKSTYAIALSMAEDAIILSSDDLRQELFNDVNHQDDNGKVFEELYKRAKENLNSGKNVIIDATNISSKRRMSAINQFSNCTKVVIYFNTPYEECLIRDSDRTRSVGKRVIDRMYRQLQIPTYAEGWDIIHLIHSEECSNNSKFKELFEDRLGSKCTYNYIFYCLLFTTEIFDNILELPHDSKYHSLSVSRHTYHVWKEIQENHSDDLVLLWAALLHDTGKYHCKEFKEEDSRYANFLGHEFVSAQLTCEFLHCLGYDDAFILKVVELVQWHMRLMGAGDSEKAIKKLKDFVGEEVFEKLSILYDADLKAK